MNADLATTARVRRPLRIRPPSGASVPNTAPQQPATSDTRAPTRVRKPLRIGKPGSAQPRPRESEPSAASPAPRVPDRLVAPAGSACEDRPKARNSLDRCSGRHSSSGGLRPTQGPGAPPHVGALPAEPADATGYDPFCAVPAQGMSSSDSNKSLRMEYLGQIGRIGDGSLPRLPTHQTLDAFHFEGESDTSETTSMDYCGAFGRIGDGWLPETPTHRALDACHVDTGSDSSRSIGMEYPEDAYIFKHATEVHCESPLPDEQPQINSWFKLHGGSCELMSSDARGVCLCKEVNGAPGGVPTWSHAGSESSFYTADNEDGLEPLAVSKPSPGGLGTERTTWSPNASPPSYSNSDTYSDCDTFKKSRALVMGVGFAIFLVITAVTLEQIV